MVIKTIRTDVIRAAGLSTSGTNVKEKTHLFDIVINGSLCCLSSSTIFVVLKC
jgi:hypothetical protein